jgi:hypothetical protein
VNSRLTVNLGLRWDLQPGPTERYNRMSGVDLTAKSYFGPLGAIVFPGVGGYSRNLWDTSWDNWGPRVGAAYQVSPSFVIRGGFGITYLPSNTGYFAGPTDYGTSMFSSGTLQQPYGPNPNGVPVGHFWDPTPLAIATGANPAAPINYGIAEAKFDRHFKNGKAMQWNIFLEKTLAKQWFVSVGYSASKSNNLENRNFPLTSIQQVPASTLADWRSQYIQSNGVTNPATVLVPNPFQPRSRAHLKLRAKCTRPKRQGRGCRRRPPRPVQSHERGARRDREMDGGEPEGVRRALVGDIRRSDAGSGRH